MTDKPRIAMSPTELPAQRLHAVVDLPTLHEGVYPAVCFGSDTEGVFPKRRPAKMTYLGSFEWAWSPMSGRITAYHLHRSRKHWLLYSEDLDPDDKDFAWVEAAHMPRANVDRRLAAIHLMIAIWQQEAEDCDLDRFHWINQEGDLSVADWMAIARLVWEGDQ